jgi:hypothetical protein
LELYRARGGVDGDPIRIVRAVSCPLASAAFTWVHDAMPTTDLKAVFGA